MLPFDESKKALNKYGHNYSDEEVKLIREFMSVLLDIDHQLYQRQIKKETSDNSEESKVITLETNSHETQSDFIHTGIYRRAS